MSKWFQLAPPRRGTEWFTTILSVYFGDIVAQGRMYNLYECVNIDYLSTLQAPTEFFAGKIVSEFNLDRSDIHWASRFVREFQKASSGGSRDLAELLAFLKRRGYQPCQKHAGADAFLPLATFPIDPYWVAENSQVRAAGVFAATRDEAIAGIERYLTDLPKSKPGYARRAPLALQEWADKGRPLTVHPPEVPLVPPMLSAAGFRLPDAPVLSLTA